METLIDNEVHFSDIGHILPMCREKRLPPLLMGVCVA